MKLLLDTHILIWSAFQPRRLAPRTRRLLEKPSNERWLSPVTAWEALLLVESGHLILDSAFEEWLGEVNAAFGFREAPLTMDVVVESRNITIPHHDPADRLLAATARFYGLRLVTSDERLLSGSGFSTLRN